MIIILTGIETAIESVVQGIAVFAPKSRAGKFTKHILLLYRIRNTVQAFSEIFPGNIKLHNRIWQAKNGDLEVFALVNRQWDTHKNTFISLKYKHLRCWSCFWRSWINCNVRHGEMRSDWCDSEDQIHNRERIDSNASASFWRNSSVCCQYVASVSGACRQYVSCFWPKKARITYLLTSTYKGSCGLLSRRSWVRAPTLSFIKPCRGGTYNPIPYHANPILAQKSLPASFWRNSSVCCQYVASVSGVCFLSSSSF